MTVDQAINILVTVSLIELMVAIGLAVKLVDVTTGVRNVGVGLVIVVNSFPGTAAVSATVAFAVFQTAAVALLALGWRRLAPATPTEPMGSAI